MMGCSVVGALFSFLPLLLAVVAIVDVIRTGADWFWIPIVLFFPVAGPLAYFVLVRSPWSGGRFANFSPATARRIQAQRRLRELAVQLAHWRGPGILVEAGQELLVLGKIAEAERHLREAQAAGAAPEDVSFPLAQALEAQGRFAEAVPLLEPLVRAKPDQRFGAVQLHLARCLDESGRAEEAVRELRDLLVRRSFFEAQVRLARLLARRGAGEESRRLLADVRASATQLPRYLKREHGPWIRAARGISRGDEKLPAPRIEGALPRGRRLRLALVSAGVAVAAVGAVALLVFAPGVGYLTSMGAIMEQQQEELKARAALEALDARAGSTAVNAGNFAPTDDDVRRYLAVRATVDPKATALLRAKEAARAAARMPGSGMSPAARMGRAKLELLHTLRTVLERERMSPRELDVALAVFEWRCLHRPQAQILGVPPHFRQDWQVAKNTLAAENADDEPERASSEDAGPSYEQAQANARAKLADIERLTGDLTMTPAAQQACKRHHDRLAATDPAVAAELVCALDATVWCF
ncbi:MAG TPA: tetratricopeptide repeat protein [Thermoanaerobaculia bacterium]|nr:tetratricopeptide repeat protein [Thermoanaerobaculia bacterium]